MGDFLNPTLFVYKRLGVDFDMQASSKYTTYKHPASYRQRECDFIYIPVDLCVFKRL